MNPPHDPPSLPVHHCSPRSDMARAYVTIFTMYGGTPPAWHPQLIMRSGEVPAVAIVHCPFCGVRLERRHFEQARS